MGWSLSKEARRHRRVSAEMPLRFRIVDAAESTKFERGMVTNISIGGLAFVSKVVIPVRTAVAFEFSLPGNLGDVAAEATVVRIVSELTDGHGIEYGVELSPTARSETLEKFVRAIDVVPWLQHMTKRGASDLHFAAFSAPLLRIQHELTPTEHKPLPPELVEALVLGTLSPQRRRTFQREREIDFPLIIPELGRWRVNAHYQRGYVEAVFHVIDAYIPAPEELGLPPIVRDLALSPGGLVLVIGPTGCGKATTLASMVEVINLRDVKLVIKLEDPIECVHENRKAVVKQREIGSDTRTFATGMQHALREDPDVIVLSELRDAETAEMVLRSAESGRVIFAGMSTGDPVQTINRIASWFPPTQRLTVLHLLSSSLRGIINLRLLKKEDGPGLVPAVEVVVANDGIRGIIRTDRLDQIPLLVASIPGGQTLEASLRSLIMRGCITLDHASHLAHDPDRLRKIVTEHRA
ncbi:MAG: PilT/PilU family type 4a pilus ATPase [Candidatus Hydrogenedentes bacterium]|nr:PilT/PilU family type 4a pilus ATPase [Candidatus Hydrogenedentota bacterium]